MHPDRTDQDRARRLKVADQVMTAMLRASQVPMTSGSFAIDGSGVWAWSVGRRAQINADFDITAAHEDIVDISLTVLDRIRAGGTPVTELLADREYSYKVPQRWALELQRRGIQPVLDLSEADQGWSDFEGARLAAGVPHCPTSADQLGHLTSPKPNQSPEVQARHHKAIELRRELAFTGNGRTAAGIPRYRCPARSGSVGCPLVPGTVAAAMENGVRVIRDVTELPGKACTQQTIALTLKAKREVWQQLYWGGPEWRRRYARRTYIEGVFGNLKNPSTENMTRGHFRVTGLLMVRLALTVVAINDNVRHLRRWHDTYGTGPADHPLLQPEPDNHGWTWLTEVEAEQNAAKHGTGNLPLAA